MHIVYFELKDGRHKNCITPLRGVNKETQNMSPCYECPARGCTRYSDGMIRAELDATTFDRVRGLDYVRIIKIVR